MTFPARRFIIIRHGETDANRDGYIAGRIEAQLTEDGRAGAKALSGWEWPELRLFVSPQQRAQETAMLAFPAHPITTIEGLRERNWGVFEGRPLHDLPPRDGCPEDGEAWDDLVQRVQAALIEGLEATPPEVLAVFVAHSGVIRATRKLLGHSPYGPSPANTRPMLYVPEGAEWREIALSEGPQV